MAKKNPVKGGGECPRCGGTLKAVRVPTDEQYRKSVDRENPQYLLEGYDTASPEQRAQLGPLFVCPDCKYNHRDAPADAATT